MWHHATIPSLWLLLLGLVFVFVIIIVVGVLLLLLEVEGGVVRELLLSARGFRGLAREERHEDEGKEREGELEVAGPWISLVIEPRIGGHGAKDHVPEGGCEAVCDVLGRKVVVEMVAACRLEIPRTIVRVKGDMNRVHDDLTDCDAAVDGVRGGTAQKVHQDQDGDAVVELDGQDGRRDDAEVSGPSVVV